MDRTPVKNLGTAGLSLAARLYVGGVPQDASGVVVNDLGEGDYSFDVPIEPPYALIVYEMADALRALWNFEAAAPPAFQPVAIPGAVLAASPGLVRLAYGADTSLRLQVSGFASDPSGASVALDLVRLGGPPVFSGLAGNVADVVGVAGRFACTVSASVPWSAWPTHPPPRTGIFWGRFALGFGGGRIVLPPDTSLRLELMGVPS